MSQPNWLGDDGEGLVIEAPPPPQSATWVDPFGDLAGKGNPYHDKGGRFTHGPGGKAAEDGDEIESIEGDADAVFEAGDAKVKTMREQAMARARGGEGLSALVESPHAVLDGYTGTSYSEINRSLYRGEAPNDRVLRMDALYDNPDVAVRNSEPITVLRGMGATEAAAIARVRPGETFVADGFLSTTTRREKIENYRVPGSQAMQITVPSGTSMLAGESIERELILDRGSRLTYDGESDGLLRFTLEAA